MNLLKKKRGEFLKCMKLSLRAVQYSRGYNRAFSDIMYHQLRGVSLNVCSSK